MSALSNALTQINERKERVLIGNEELTFAATPPSPNHIAVAYFGLVATATQHSSSLSSVSQLPSQEHPDHETQHRQLTLVDSLRLIRIDHEFNVISKDLFEKFRVVRTSVQWWHESERNFVNSSLLSNGFKTCKDLSIQLGRIKDFYVDILSICSSSRKF